MKHKFGMSHSNEHDSHTDASSVSDEVDNYDSNDADSLNLDEEEEEEDGGGPFALACNLSDRLVGGSIVLHIDQTPPLLNNESGSSIHLPGSFSSPTFQNPLSTPQLPPFVSNDSELNPVNSNITSGFVQADQSISTTTSLSDTASDNMSTRAVMGDNASTYGNNGLRTVDEDEGDNDNSSQASLADSEAERVRRIHNSIFNSLENDLAELVRIREETIQFLENGTRATSTLHDNILPPPNTGENSADGTNNNEEISTTPRPAGVENEASSNIPTRDQEPTTEPFFLRERVTIRSRPFSSFHSSFPRVPALAALTNTIATTPGNSYSVSAKFDHAPPAKPAKPYLENGLTNCDEKAAAARKILDKLQYGDPEDEGACFVRRFWRETSTQDNMHPSGQVPSPMSMDIATMAERTASLEATLEEAFDSIRLRLQQAATDTSAAAAEAREQGRQGTERADNEESGGTRGQRIDPNAVPYYDAWDEETSIMNNPLNYDIWNELEDGSDAGPTITARINLAERRANAVSQIRGGTSRSTEARSGENQGASTTVGVGTGMEGAELDDDSTDDEEISNYFRFSADSILNPSSDAMRNLREESRDFFREIGIPEEFGRDLFNMFTFSEDDVRIPPTSANESLDNGDIPDPLFPGNEDSDAENNETAGQAETSQEQGRDQLPAVEEKEAVNENGQEENSPQQNPLLNMDEPAGGYSVNCEGNDCSARVYLDENDLNFPYETAQGQENYEYTVQD